MDTLTLANSQLIAALDSLTIQASDIDLQSSQVLSGQHIAIGTDTLTQHSGQIWAAGNLTIDDGAGGRATAITNTQGDMVAYTGDLTLRASSITNEGKKPTFIPDGYQVQWTENASSTTTADLLPNTWKLIDAAYLDANGEPKPEYTAEYTALLQALSTGSTPSAEAQSILKASVLNGDGSINPDFTGVWSQVANQANSQGISNLQTYLDELLIEGFEIEVEVPELDDNGDPLLDENDDPVMTTETQLDSIWNEDGTIETEYQDAYLNLWLAALGEAELSTDTLALLETGNQSADGQFITGISDKFTAMMASSGTASYEIRYTLIADVPANDGILGRWIAGGDVVIDTNELNNIHANISAGGDININADTQVNNLAYGASQTLYELHKKPGCFTCHTGSLGYRETFGGLLEAGGNINIAAGSVSSQVEATRDTRFNLPHVEEFHNHQDGAQVTPEDFKVLLDVTADEVTEEERTDAVHAGANETGTADTSDADHLSVTSSQTGNSGSNTQISGVTTSDNSVTPNTSTPSITTGNTSEFSGQFNSLDPLNLGSSFPPFLLAAQTDKPYEQAIETRDPYVDYGGFLSSDYMMQRLQYSPEHEPRLNGDEWEGQRNAQSNGNRIGQTLLSGNNINISTTEGITLAGGLDAEQQVNLTTEGDITSSAVIKAGTDANLDAGGNVSQSGGGIQAESLKVTAEDDIDFSAMKLAIAGDAEFSGDNVTLGSETQSDSGRRGDVNWANSREVGVEAEVVGDFTVKAKNDFTMRASTVKAEGLVDVVAQHDINIEAGNEYQTHSYERSETKKKWYGKKTTTTESHSEQHLTYSGSVLEGKQGVKTNAGHDTNIIGSTVKSAEVLDFYNGNTFNMLNLEEQHEVNHNESKSSSWLGFINLGSSNSNLSELSTKAYRADASAESLSSGSGSDSTFQAANLDAKRYRIRTGVDEDGNIINPEAKLHFKTAEEYLNYQAQTYKDNGLWFKSTDQGEVSVTSVYNNIKAPTDPDGWDVQSPGGIEVDVGVNQDKDDNLQQLVSKLSTQPGMEWLGELQQRDDVNWNAVENAFNEWNYEQEGLTPQAAALISLAVGMATSGAGTALLNSALGTSISSPALVAALNAGYTTLAQSATLSFINNKGDLGAVFDELGSSDSLKNLASSMITAGLTAGINLEDTFGLKLGDQMLIGTVTPDQIGNGILRATLRAGVDTAIHGGELDDALRANLKNFAIDTIGQVASEKIGAVYKAAGQDGTSAGEYGLHKLTHTLLGCAMGEASNGDCASGAVGGLVGSVAADAYDQTRDELLEMLGNADLTQEQAQQYFNRWQQRGIDISRLTAGFAALLTEHDVNLAASTAGNAAEHNILPAIIIAFKVGMVAWTAYELHESVETAIALYNKLEDGTLTDAEIQDALIGLGIEVAVDVTVGRLKLLEKLGEGLQAMAEGAKQVSQAAYDKLKKLHDDVLQMAQSAKDGDSSELATAGGSQLNVGSGDGKGDLPEGNGQFSLGGSGSIPFQRHSQDLQVLIDELTYANRPNVSLEVPGGVAGAIRHTRDTEELVGGSDHIQKGKDILGKLRKLRKRINNAYSMSDDERSELLSSLNYHISDLEDALP